MSEEQPANFGIRCAHTAQHAPQELKPHPKNPNEHPEEQLAYYMSILRYQGWRRPVTVSTRSGFITKGHGAVLAAIKAGQSLVPVDYQDYDDEAQELADIVADNQLARMSQMDIGKLIEIKADLESMQVDVSLAALDAQLMPLDSPEWNSDIEDKAKKEVDKTKATDEGIAGKITLKGPKELINQLKPEIQAILEENGWSGMVDFA